MQIKNTGENWLQLIHLIVPLDGAWTDAPINGSTFFAVKKSSQLNISVDKGGTSDFSSDLSLGRRPIAKSVEFFISTKLSVEI